MFNHLVVLFVLCASVAACARPENIAVARRSLDAGIIYRAELTRVVPVYVASYSREIYANAGAAAGSILADEALLGSTNDFRIGTLGGTVGGAIATVIEGRKNRTECNYFVKTDAPALIRSVDPQSRSQVSQPGLAEAIFARELQTARQELSQFKREIDEVAGAFLREGREEDGAAHIAQLRDLSARREAMLDDLEARMYRERDARLPGEVEIAIINPCREVSAGAEVLIIDYGQSYVIELVE